MKKGYYWIKTQKNQKHPKMGYYNGAGFFLLVDDFVNHCVDLVNGKMHEGPCAPWWKEGAVQVIERVAVPNQVGDANA